MRKSRTLYSLGRSLTVVCCLAASEPIAARAADGTGFPYAAYVVEPDTYVRSGPGGDHYPTGQVPAGYAVEVYRHDAGGWCAIRPPDGSFSLAPAHQLRIIDQHTAEVTTGGVVARVGSSVSPQRNAVQVLLERGEVVQLVEPPKPNDAWVKIAPPAGEFRWISARRLSRSPPVEGGAPPVVAAQWQGRSPGAAADSKPSSTSSTDNRFSPPQSATPVADDSDPFAHLRSASAPAQVAAVSPRVGVAPNVKVPWQPLATVGSPASAAPSAADASSNSDIDIVPGSPADVRLVQYQQVGGATASAPTSTPNAANDAPGLTIAPPAEAGSPAPSGIPRVRFSGESTRGPVDPRVAEMQLRLSEIVVQPPTSWQFAAIREEAAGMLAQVQTPEVRGQLRDLLDRIATFETVQARYRTPAGNALAGRPGEVAGAAASGGGSSRDSELLARVRSDLARDDGVTPTPGGSGDQSAPGGPAAKPATEAIYDAVGTLKPVISRRDHAPQYALVDDHGDVVTFVTAAPDVNLQPYIGKRIGIRGSRGYMPEYRRAHVTASRITPLEDKLLR